MAWWNPRDWFEGGDDKDTSEPEPKTKVTPIKRETTSVRHIDYIDSSGKSGSVTKKTSGGSSWSGGGSSGGSSSGSSKRSSSSSSKNIQPAQDVLKEYAKPGKDVVVETDKVKPSAQTTSQQIKPGETATSGGEILLVTPEEAEELKGSPTPFWELESKDIKSQFIEVDYASKVTPSDTKTILGAWGITPSSGQRESTQAQINIQKEGFRTEQDIRKAMEGFEKERKKTSKEFKSDPTQFEGEKGFYSFSTKEGTKYELRPSYFEGTEEYKDLQKSIKVREEYESEYFDKEGKLKQTAFNKELLKARKKFDKEDSFITGTAAKLGDIEIGARKAGLGVTEFGYDLTRSFGMQDPTQESVFKEYDLPFGKKTISTPTSKIIGKGGTTPTLLDTTKSFFKGETPGAFTEVIPIAIGSSASITGAGKGASSLQYLSPFRLKTGVYTPVQSEMASKKGGTLAFQGKKGQLSFSKFSSKDYGFNVETTQVSRNVGGRISGKSFTQYKNVPYIKIGGKGGASMGRLSTDTITQFEGGQYGDIFKGTGTTIYDSTLTGAGIVKDVALFGQSSTGVSTGTITGISGYGGEDVSGFTKTGRFKLGIESPSKYVGARVDVSKYFGGKSEAGTTFIKGKGGGTPLSKTFQQTQSFTTPLVTSSFSKTITTSTTTGGSVMGTGSIFGGTKLAQQPKERSITTPTISSTTLTKEDTKQKSTPTLTTETITFPKFDQRSFTTPQISQTPSQLDLTKTKTKTRVTTKQITKPTITTSTTPLFKTPFTSGGGFYFPPLNFRLGFGRGKRKPIKRRKQKTAYTPSFEAAALGIKAPKIPKLYSKGAGGLISRPVIVGEKKKKKSKKKKRRKK